MQFPILALLLIAIALPILILAQNVNNNQRRNLPQNRSNVQRPFRPAPPPPIGNRARPPIRRPAAIAAPLKKQKQFSPESVKTVNQCLCADIRPCKERYMSALGPCLDTCQVIRRMELNC
jgi:hypothetical protein